MTAGAHGAPYDISFLIAKGNQALRSGPGSRWGLIDFVSGAEDVEIVDYH